MRLIDADALIAKLRTEIKRITPIEESRDMFYHDSGLNCATTGAILSIKNAPTIDAVPVVHGRWTKGIKKVGAVTMDVYYCSKCSNLVLKKLNYCSDCGAKMDGEEQPELIPILCKHASSAKKNEIGQTVVYCEMCAAWQNVTLGDCYGSCECQEVCDE